MKIEISSKKSNNNYIDFFFQLVQLNVFDYQHK